MSGQPPSQKWVDYTDSDSSDEPHRKQSQMSSTKSDHKSTPAKKKTNKITYPPSRQETNQELDKLDELDDLRTDQVWVEAFSQNLDYLGKEMEYLKGKAKKGGNIVHVYPTKQPTLFQLKVYINTAYEWVQRGYNRQDYLQIRVASRNFDRKTRNYSPKHQDTKKGGFTKQQKKRYVDKKSSQLSDLPKEETQPESNMQSILEKNIAKEQEEKINEKKGQKEGKKEEVEEKEGKKERPNAVADEDKPKVVEPVVKQAVPSQQFSAPPKKESKPVEVKKEKQGKKGKKQVASKNIKSTNPFDGMLDL